MRLVGKQIIFFKTKISLFQEDHVSVVSIGNSARDQRKQRLKSERVTQKLKKDGFFAAGYDTSFDDASTRFYGFRNGKKSYRMCELGTTV